MDLQFPSSQERYECSRGKMILLQLQYLRQEKKKKNETTCPTLFASFWPSEVPHMIRNTSTKPGTVNGENIFLNRPASPESRDVDLYEHTVNLRKKIASRCHYSYNDLFILRTNLKMNMLSSRENNTISPR